MEIACLDLEGVLVPEVWIGVAEKTGIAELRATTRDVPDYRQLMDQRLSLLEGHGLTLNDIQRVIDGLGPLEGARDFLDWMQREFQVVILSDTFYEFAAPLMAQLNWPTLFCHRLEVDENAHVTGYNLRMSDHKRQAVEAFKSLNFKVIAAGDSYNDATMLDAADHGILFRAPANVVAEFPQFPHTESYAGLQAAFESASDRFSDIGG